MLTKVDSEGWVWHATNRQLGYSAKLRVTVKKNYQSARRDFLPHSLRLQQCSCLA